MNWRHSPWAATVYNSPWATDDACCFGQQDSMKVSIAEMRYKVWALAVSLSTFTSAWHGFARFPFLFCSYLFVIPQRLRGSFAWLSISFLKFSRELSWQRKPCSFTPRRSTILLTTWLTQRRCVQPDRLVGKLCAPNYRSFNRLDLHLQILRTAEETYQIGDLCNVV